MKKLTLSLLFAMLPAVAFADDALKSEPKLDLNIRRIGLDWSRTDVGHSDKYADSPVSALTATDQDFMKGIFDVALEYKKNK